MSWINKDKCVKGMKIDLGAGNPDQGEIQGQGYVLNDVQQHKNIDLVCRIQDLAEFIPEGFCSELRLSHVFEHFTKQEGIDLLKMFHKLLENNGKLVIIVPNFKWHCELLLTGQDEMAVHYAFGGQLDEYDIHKTAFTPKILKKRLEENGFKVESIDNLTSITCVALKT
jgi:predicted SAM-dependent methyltransferase